MNRAIGIELFEDHDEVNFYTLRFDGEHTEIDKFFDRFPDGCKYDEDINIIIKWIDQIGQRGAMLRYFRPESKRHDDIYAIPIETSKIRVYVIRITDNIVILGNGGIKTTPTYNEDPQLNAIVELLQKVNRYFNSRLRNSTITYYQKTLYGSLSFYLKD